MSRVQTFYFDAVDAETVLPIQVQEVGAASGGQTEDRTSTSRRSNM
jgi:hypothetical protein